MSTMYLIFIISPLALKLKLSHNDHGKNLQTNCNSEITTLYTRKTYKLLTKATTS